MKEKTRLDITKAETIILSILWQHSDDNFSKIDNQCLSCYEDACDYMASKGYLRSDNGRIYTPQVEFDVVRNCWVWKNE